MLPLICIAYDPKDDLVEIVLESLDHMIRKPGGIYLQNGAPNAGEHRSHRWRWRQQIVKFKDELSLPPQRR